MFQERETEISVFQVMACAEAGHALNALGQSAAGFQVACESRGHAFPHLSASLHEHCLSCPSHSVNLGLMYTAGMSDNYGRQGPKG